MQPVLDLLSYLAGAWLAERTMLDRATGSRGTFTGVVTFTETPDGGLLLREEGTMHWPSHSGPASREYVLRPSDQPQAMDVFFRDGRPFHRMSFAPEDRHDRHWCDPDTYRVSYTWEGPQEFSYAWDVQGPAKDLLLQTRLRKEP
ncbi:DUF6314 family protein [Arthrobacter sp. ISL-30]|uniref:DUF6314 family protein n=1 Tax=Arthrobacter sp. ISL-30 TaxID=2819109 RepID=UPI0027DF7AA4|nr:DUF6314 family protein [Arthrobacter sp. ISL-30]